ATRGCKAERCLAQESTPPPASALEWPGSSPHTSDGEGVRMISIDPSISLTDAVERLDSEEGAGSAGEKLRPSELCRAWV
ncbi:MAG: hypothetical protein ACPIOQ_00590, partial [Promethearchaeia archaeon]